jgi:hypothetical protein
VGMEEAWRRGRRSSGPPGRHQGRLGLDLWDTCQSGRLVLVVAAETLAGEILQDDFLQTVVFLRATRRRAAGWGSVILFLERGEFDGGESFFLDQVDEVDRFGLSLETSAALWAGEDLAPVHGRITTPPRGRNDSNVESQGTASGAVAAFVSADSAGVSTGWGSAGVSVVAVVVAVGRHVSFGWMSARSTGDLWLCDLFGVVEVGRMFGLLRRILRSQGSYLYTSHRPSLLGIL